MKINGKPDGGGGGGVITGLTAISNGIYTAGGGVDGYSPVEVNVQPSLQDMTITVNGSYTADEGYYGLNTIIVSVPDVPAVTETLSVTVNGTYTPGVGVDGFSQVSVNVPMTGWDQKSITEKTFTITDLNNGASYVASYAFILNSTLKTVNLPNATTVGNNAFSNCNSLTQVSLPVCEYVGNYAFSNCNSLTQVSLPVCEYVGNDVFNACSSLTQVSLPICKKLGDNTFRNCSSLTQVSLPVCSYIGSRAFQSCSSLSIVSLPECIYINGYAFQSCSSLSEVYLPVCSSINNNTFQGCTSLNHLTLCNDVYWTIPYSTNVLSLTPIINGSGSIYVRSDTYNNWITSTGWSSLASVFVSIEYSEPVISFSDGLLYGTTKIIMSNYSTVLGISKNDVTTVSLPECEYVYNNTFNGCNSLTNITLPKCSYLYDSALHNVGLNSNPCTLTLGYSGVVGCGQGVLNNAWIEFIFVPASLVDAYKASNTWYWLSNKIFSIPE